jgi:hypothetical protein
MSQVLGLAGTIGSIVATFVIVLGVIWHIQSGPDDGIENALATPRSCPNQAGAGDELRRRIEDIEEKLDVHRKYIIRIKRRVRGAGAIIWALICATVSLYALVRDDWVFGLCGLAMALALGTYGAVNVFGSEKHQWRGGPVDRLSKL